MNPKLLALLIWVTPIYLAYKLGKVEGHIKSTNVLKDLVSTLNETRTGI